MFIMRIEMKMWSRLLALAKSTTLHVCIGLLLSALFLYLALRNVNWADVWISLRQASLGYVCLAIISVIINTLAKAFRWRILLAQSERRLPFSKILTAFMIGQMLNVVLPVRMGELGRIYVAGMREVGAAFVAGTIVVEKLVDMICFALLFALLVFLLPLPTWIHESSYVVIGLAGVAVLLLLALSRRRLLDRLVIHLPGWLPLALRERLSRSFRSGFDSMQAFQRRRDLIGLINWSIVVWATSLLNVLLVLFACNLSLPLSATLLLVVALQIGISLSNAPAWIGVFEYVCVLSLAIFGVDQVRAFSFGVLLHSIVLIPHLCAVFLLFIHFRPAPKPPGIQGQSV